MNLENRSPTVRIRSSAVTDFAPVLDGCRFDLLTAEGGPEVQALFERCADYVQMYSGAPPGPDEGREACSAHPPGTDPADKFAFGIRRPGGEMAGFLDLVRDFPAPGEWWLGLLMLDPAARSGGWGARIYAAVARWVRERGGHTLWIGVLEENPAAERFWRGQGFAEVRREPYTADSGKAHTVIVLRHDLDGG